MVDNTVFLTTPIRYLRGNSQPILAAASDGRTYVVKTHSGEAGSHLSFNEAAGTLLYRALGLSTPRWKPLLKSSAFATRMAMISSDRLDIPSLPTGISFGSEFVGGVGNSAFEILSRANFQHIENQESLWKAWLVDICVRHTDNRQIIFKRDSNRRLMATFIDHGHMFGGPNGTCKPHPIASRYLDRRIYSDVSSAQLHTIVQQILQLDADGVMREVLTMPEEWKSASAVRAFEVCLNRLQDSRLVASTADKAMGTWEDERKQDFRRTGTAHATILEILRPVLSDTSARR